MGAITKMAAYRRKRAVRIAAGGFIGGVMIGLAFLFLPPLLASADVPLASPIALVAAEGKACGHVSVHDGDTFRCDGMKIRLVALGGPVDAPDFVDSPRCQPGRGGWCDQALAERSRDRLTAMLNSGRVQIDCDGADRYGRALCRASVDGRDAGDTLIAEGLARIMERWR